MYMGQDVQRKQFTMVASFYVPVDILDVSKFPPLDRNIFTHTAAAQIWFTFVSEVTFGCQRLQSTLDLRRLLTTCESFSWSRQRFRLPRLLQHSVRRARSFCENACESNLEYQHHRKFVIKRQDFMFLSVHKSRWKHRRFWAQSSLELSW